MLAEGVSYSEVDCSEKQINSYTSLFYIFQKW